MSEFKKTVKIGKTTKPLLGMGDGQCQCDEGGVVARADGQGGGLVQGDNGGG